MISKTKIVLFSALVWLTGAFSCFAQSGPNWSYQYVPSPAEWQFWWTHKQDYNGVSACLVSGCTFSGPVITAASTANAAGFNITPGVAPTTPNNGDLWVTAAGIFVRINGSTLQLSSGGASIGVGGTNQVAIYTAPSTINGIATANNGVLVTNGAGAPSISSTLPSGIAATNMNLTTPSLGVATGTSLALNGCSISTYSLCLNGGAGGGAYIFSATTTAFVATGAGGLANPVLAVDGSVGSQATGFVIRGAAAAAGAFITVTSSGVNEGMALNAKGSGTIILGNTSTGGLALAQGGGGVAINTCTIGSNAFCVNGSTFHTSTSATAFAIGANGATNPAFNIDASTASSATGWNIKSAAAAGGVALSVISSGTNENGTIDAKGSGTLTLNGTATGIVNVNHGLTVLSSFTATGLVTLADMANVTTAWALFGNPSASTSATPAYFTISSLTTKASPAGTDLILIQDQAASGQIKQATVSSIASAGSVSSIDGLTGAFTTSNGVTSTGNSLQLTTAWRTEPTVSIVTTGSHSGGFGANASGTYTTPANVRRIRITMWGAGGGSTGSGTGAGAAGTGGNTCWNTSGAACTTPVLQSSGGTGPTNSGQVAGGAGGAGTSGGTACNVFAQNGQGGGGGNALTTNGSGIIGGNNGFGMGGAAPVPGGGNAGSAGLADSGGGASGASGNGVVPGAGGGGGGVCVHDIANPAGSYTYAVGAAGTAGGAGTSGAAGAAGGGGKITVQEFYGTSWLLKRDLDHDNDNTPAFMDAVA